jgi:hypothetical protein
MILPLMINYQVSSKKKDEELAVNTGGGMEIWPIVAGVVGAITVCIIVLLIALRRHRNGQKQKTVAVIPNTKGYGKVAVVTVKNGSGALP